MFALFAILIVMKSRVLTIELIRMNMNVESAHCMWDFKGFLVVDLKILVNKNLNEILIIVDVMMMIKPY